MRRPVFVLVDYNNFYASCEKLFCPDLRKTPVVVLSNNDGCVVDCSKPVNRRRSRSDGPRPATAADGPRTG